MKLIFISDLKAGVDITNEPFLLHEVNGRKTRDGRPFLLLNIRDKSGSTGGVFWDVPDYVSSWAQSGSVALVTGRVNKYKDALQISVTDMNPCTDVDLADFCRVQIHQKPLILGTVQAKKPNVDLPIGAEAQP